jgi:hypothetical protein
MATLGAVAVFHEELVDCGAHDTPASDARGDNCSGLRRLNHNPNFFVDHNSISIGTKGKHGDG